MTAEPTPTPPANPLRPDDPSLAAAVADGRREALGELYERHAAHVYTLARRILRGDAEAESVVSDVFLEFWRRPEGFDASRGSCRTYLLVVARSRAIDRLRARSKRANHTEAAGLEHHSERSDREADATPPRRVIRSEHNRLVREAIERLDDRQREPITLAYFEGLTHREIAQRLDQPLGTVKTRIRAAMESLRSALRSLGREA